jgi:hypothetical protein
MAITYTLKRPVTSGEATFTELVFPRPAMKDFIACGTGQFGDPETDAKIISSLTGVPMIAVRKIDIDDAAKLRYLISRIWAAWFALTDGYTEQTLEDMEAAAKENPRTETAESA